MADVIIKDVPEGCEASVRETAMVAIERHMTVRDLSASHEKVAKYKADIDLIRVHNNLVSKFIKGE